MLVNYQILSCKKMYGLDECNSILPQKRKEKIFGSYLKQWPPDKGGIIQIAGCLIKKEYKTYKLL